MVDLSPTMMEGFESWNQLQYLPYSWNFLYSIFESLARKGMSWNVFGYIRFKNFFGENYLCPYADWNSFVTNFNKTFIFLRKSFSKSLVYLPIYFSLIWQKIWPSSLQSIYCTSVPVFEIQGSRGSISNLILVSKDIFRIVWYVTPFLINLNMEWFNRSKIS